MLFLEVDWLRGTFPGTNRNQAVEIVKVVECRRHVRTGKMFRLQLEKSLALVRAAREIAPTAVLLRVQGFNETIVCIDCEHPKKTNGA